jgi:glycosyltransferase 2 family protein
MGFAVRRKLMSNLKMNFKYLKIFFGITLLSFLLVKFDFDQVLETILLSNSKYIIIGFSLFFISTIFEVYKFFFLLSTKFKLFEATSIVYSGLFFNNFMPTNIGGDAYRIVKLSKKTSFRMSSIIVLLDRLNGLTLILLISLIAIFLRPIDLTMLSLHIESYEPFFIFISIFFLIGCFFLIFSGHATKVLKDLKLISKSKFALSLIFTIFFHISRIFGIYFFVVAVGGDINIIDIAVILSIVLLISVIPISVGALGIREAAFVVGFSIYSIDPVSGLAVAILTRFFLFFQAIVGYVFFTKGK